MNRFLRLTPLIFLAACGNSFAGGWAGTLTWASACEEGDFKLNDSRSIEGINIYETADGVELEVFAAEECERIPGSIKDDVVTIKETKCGKTMTTDNGSGTVTFTAGTVTLTDSTVDVALKTELTVEASEKTVACPGTITGKLKRNM